MHHPLQQQQREQQQQPIESERNPLILPEIRRIVGQFLENKDILSLICVSHAFYLDFVPFLWSTLVFDSHLQKALTRKAFQEHGHSVRNLTLQAYDTVLECWQDAQCTNLRSLEILPTVNVLRRMTLEEFDESIADIEELDNEMDIEPTAKPKQGVMAVQRKIRSRLENRAFKLIDLIQHQRNLSILKLNWVTAFSGELLKRFYCFTNQLVALHLSKWTVELQDLNLLVRNSPCLREFFARGLSVEPTALDPSASNPTGFLDSTLTSSEISGVTLLGSKQQLQDQYSLHPILNFRQIRRVSSID
ncbi:hypothetical protein BGX26_003970 [Mortierella sp. AD094]|nr:hypothetical protein BGX26_003970 [Mortierella sp. AD094]